jgi:hypothetical protein
MSIIAPEISSAGDVKVFAIGSEISTTVSLGSGYDSRTRSVKNLVAEGTVTKEVRQNTEARYAIDWCDTYSKMSSFFGLAASASYSGASSGISASVNIMRSTAIESSRIYIAARVYIIANAEYYVGARLNDDALRVLKKESLANFSEKYGGVYARSLLRGGELACVLEISASSNETIEQLRAAMSAYGWGAKGQVEMEQSLSELTRTRSVVVRYCQSGGAVGDGTTGIIVTDANGLIARIKQFIPEVWGSNGLDGNTVPLRAELESSRFLTNWPSDKTGDPDRPYPDEIEHVAKSALLLKDKLVVAEEVLRKSNMVAPSSSEAAGVIVPYLQLVVELTTSELGKMLRGTSPQLDLWIESLFQYRIRNFLDVDLGNHVNAGPMVNLGNMDARQFLERVFGKNIPASYERWPKLSIQEWWGYQGQEPGMFPNVAFHVICPQHGGNILETAKALAGNPGPDAGILVHASGSTQSYFGGNACGYTPVHAIAIKTERPSITELDPLPNLPGDAIDSSTLVISNASLELVGENIWNASFSLAVGVAGSCGKFKITIRETTNSKPMVERTRSFESYWLNRSNAELRLAHNFNSDPKWVPQDFHVEVERAFKMDSQ